MASCTTLEGMIVTEDPVDFVDYSQAEDNVLHTEQPVSALATPAVTPKQEEAIGEAGAMYDAELGGWVTKWSGDFDLVGVTPNLSGMELWFGDRGGKSQIVQYPMTALPALMLYLVEGDRTKVYKTGIHLSSLPPGWVRVVASYGVYP